MSEKKTCYCIHSKLKKKKIQSKELAYPKIAPTYVS